MENGLLEGLLTLKDMGATQLVVDVVGYPSQQKNRGPYILTVLSDQ
jgi:hypothetical protein